MNCSDKKTNNDPVCQMPLVATDAKESLVHEGRRYDFCSVVAPNHVLTVNQDLETRVELMEIERHGSKVETPSLYRREGGGPRCSFWGGGRR